MDWSLIDDSKFEELACAYAKDNYSMYKWIPTGKSWDGNTDAEFRDKIDGINHYYKGWCEAKYTCKPDSSIPKSHMDSTLVSGILDGEVVFILFVTNGRIANSFVQRATAILRPHKIEIKFVDGFVLTGWLKENPDIQSSFFGVSNANEPKYFCKIEIADCCVLNAALSSPALISGIKKLHVQTEYFLYLNILSTERTSYSLETLTDTIKLLPNSIYEDIAMPGYNSVLVKFIAKHPCKKNIPIRIQTETNETIFDDVLSLTIDECEHVRVVYEEQQQYIQEMYNTLTEDIYRNAIIGIAGYEGSGKTYLLNQLLQSLMKEDTEILQLAFSDKESENASSLCKLILFINFGFLYDLSEQAFKTLIKSQSGLLFELLLQLREGTSDQITALNIIDTVSNTMKEKNLALFPNHSPMFRRNLSYIVLDDFQKITKRHKSLCQYIFTEFTSRDYSQIIIVAYRPKEFQSSGMENMLQKLCSRRWELSGISNSDVYNSLKLCFNQDIAKLSQLFAPPISVLHLELLLKKLKHMNILHMARERRAVIYSKAYQETNVNDINLAKNKILHCQYKDILYVVYKIESGVPVQLLQEFFSSKFDRVCHLFSADTLFKEENSLLKPYHDIYLNAFKGITFSSKYMDTLNGFLQFCIQENINSPILKSNILAILIDPGNKLHTHYRPQAKEICQDYYAKSQYIAAQSLAIALLPDIDRTPQTAYHYDDLELLYIYAQSVKYAKTHAGSSKYLKKICSIAAIMSLKPNEMGVVHEAHSELITNELYSLDFKSVEEELSYAKKHLNHVTLESPWHTVNAYLNFANRAMLYEFFTDRTNLQVAYENAVNESRRLERADYEAYAKMDYAKIIFHEEPIRAISLLEEALPVFEKYPECEKRRIDCLFEIFFIQYIIKQDTHEKLYNLQSLAHSNSFAHVYARITITLLTTELIEGGSPEEIELRLNKLIVEYSDIQNTNRLSFFVNQLFAAIGHRQGEAQKKRKYLEHQLNLKEAFPNSYVSVVDHNLNTKESAPFAWTTGEHLHEAAAYLLDPRIW